MGERIENAPEELVERHLRVMSRLPFGSSYFDRTSQIDLRLVEAGEAPLANELAMLEERMAEIAEEIGEPAGKADGVARILAKDPALARRLRDHLSRALAVLGNPLPRDLAGKVQVAVDLQLSPEHGQRAGIRGKGKLDVETN